MPALLSWALLLGGIATTVAAAALSAEVEFEVALALGGLLATLLGAVGVLLSRVAGDAPSDLRPPGATARVNLPTGPARAMAPATATKGRGRSGRTPAARSPDGSSARGGVPPPTAAIPTAPPSTGISRTPVLLAAFVVGVAWELTNSPTSSGLLDMIAGLLFIATPIAVVIGIASRFMAGRAWGPAVTVAMVGISLFAGSLAVSLVESMLA